MNSTVPKGCDLRGPPEQDIELSDQQAILRQEPERSGRGCRKVGVSACHPCGVTYYAELHPGSPDQRPAWTLSGAKMMDPDTVSC